jgi:hypothetical protein
MMRRLGTVRLAWTLGAVALVLTLAGVVLAGLNGESLPELAANHHAIGIVTAIGLSVLGALVGSRRPGNPIGWLMCAGAVPRRLQLHPAVRAPGVAESLPGLAVVDQTVQPTTVSLWRKPGR